MAKPKILNLPHTFLYYLLLLAFMAGCQGQNTKKWEPVYYPAPVKPRLQFLRSYEKPQDVGVKGPGAFEVFIVGEEQTASEIAKPYGIDTYDGKIYVCDVSRKLVEVLDPANHTFDFLTKDRRLINPVNIYIAKTGAKYVADPTAGAVFVFDGDNNLQGILGKDLGISPGDVVVRGKKCYVTDSNSNQVVVFDLVTEKEIQRIGKQGETPGVGEFEMIGGIALDADENVYVSDKSKGELTKFNKEGIYQYTVGKSGDALEELVRPKGMGIDHEGRIWVVDAGTDVGKIYRPDGQLLMYFGLPGNQPGMMNLPADIKLDYDHIELFRDYIAQGAQIEFVVLVTNQYGPNKISAYAFGSFPIQEKEAQEKQKQWESERRQRYDDEPAAEENPAQTEAPTPAAETAPAGEPAPGGETSPAGKPAGPKE